MTLQATETAIRLPGPDVPVDEAQLAIVAFLARYTGRTLEAYRHDLRMYFQWALENDLAVLAAARAHVELYRCSMEERGLAASTIDRGLSTVCGFYRFAHIDGRIASNPAQYVRRPKVQPNEGHGMDRGELGTFLFTAERYDRAHAALAVLLGLNGLRVSEACATNIEDLGFHRGHRTLQIVGKGQQARGDPPRAPDRPHHRSRHRGTARRVDPVPPGRAATRPSHRASVGPLDRATGRARRRASAHAAGRVHHGRPRRRGAAPRRPPCRPPRRPTHHHDL
jgi:integrase